MEPWVQQLTAPLQTAWQHVPIKAVVLLLGLGVLLLVLTNFKTTYDYKRWSQSPNNDQLVQPPRLPYTIPWLGSALSLLSPTPGCFWDYLAINHATKAGALAVLLGGERMYVLFSPVALQALYKARKVSRHVQTEKALVDGFGMERSEVVRYFDSDGSGTVGKDGKRVDRFAQQENIMINYLFKHEPACGLNRDFERLLVEELREYKKQVPTQGKEIDVCAWIKLMMGRASTKAFMGTELFKAYPTMLEDFLEFDDIIMTLFFGIPRFMAPGAYAVREKLLQGLQDWHKHIQVDTEPILSPDSPQRWDPALGARCLRARHIMYKEVHLNARSKASQDLGFLFALSSNSIPTAAYMLMHILDPAADPTLLSRVKTELTKSWLPDGSAVDIERMSAQPLLQSIFYEVLRIYMDFLITRHCDEDTVLPTVDPRETTTKSNNKDNKNQTAPLLFPAGSTILAPTWLGHHDPAFWTSPPHTVFYPERFLTTDPESDETIFSLANANGKVFPFGGGKTICPGRTFAKQEVFTCLAWVLRVFEVEVEGFVDSKGRGREGFPPLQKQFTGTGIMGVDGDLRVRVKGKEGE